MDRFIEYIPYRPSQNVHNLKSNMDRFIDLKNYYRQTDNKYLKSNMDRFIVGADVTKGREFEIFKIQYG